jgi:ferredoxin
MTYVVTEKCIKCKYTDCAIVCPVKCFYEGENMLVINPDECIDCGVCELECPIGAISPESSDLIDMIEVNREYSQKWPRIVNTKPPLPDADKYKDETGKFKKYFSSKPG